LFTVDYMGLPNVLQMFYRCLWQIDKNFGSRRNLKKSGELAYSESRARSPMFTHALILGLIALTVSFLLASGYAWELIGKTTSWILNAVGIKANYVGTLYWIYLNLRDGTLTVFQVVVQCSGLITVAIFSFIYTFTVGLLKGSLLNKIAWFLLSIGIGFLWNINRLTFVIIIAYNFGHSAFSFTHYLLGPFIDFLWIVTMWSLSMSRLKGEAV